MCIMCMYIIGKKMEKNKSIQIEKTEDIIENYIENDTEFDGINRYKEIAERFETFEEMYEKLLEHGIRICKFCLDDKDNVWKRMELKWMLDYFESKEDYKKCESLKNLIDSDDYIASEEKQKELNIKLSEYHKKLKEY